MHAAGWGSMESARGLLASLRVNSGLPSARVWLDGHAVRARKEDLEKEADCGEEEGGEEGREDGETGGERGQETDVSDLRESPGVSAQRWLPGLSIPGMSQ